jgi:hypothetical protein
MNWGVRYNPNFRRPGVAVFPEFEEFPALSDGQKGNEPFPDWASFFDLFFHRFYYTPEVISQFDNGRSKCLGKSNPMKKKKGELTFAKRL